MNSLLLATLFATGIALAAPPSIEDLQRPPAFSGAVLSPDGRHVAAIINPDGKTTSLAVIATDNPGEAAPLKAFGQADIRQVFWLDNTRLAFTVRPRVDGEGYAIGAGLWTLNRDGSGLRQWVNPDNRSSADSTPQARRALGANWSLYQSPSPGRPGELVLRHYVGGLQGWVTHVELARLDVATGQRQALTEGAPEKTLHWVLDAAGNPAFAFGSNGRGGSRVMWRNAEGQWMLWHETGDGDPARRPLAIDRAGRLYLMVNENGRMALHRAESLAPDAPTVRVLGSSSHSLVPQLLRDADSDELVGVHFEAEVPQTAWFAPVLAAAQADIDRQLPGAANQIDCQRCLAVPTLLVRSYSDRRPPRYFLYDREAGRLTALASSMPWMGEGRPRQLATTAARDGLRLPLVVTHPALSSPGPAPTVLLVHGGPWVRGNLWAWQAEPQFYASRGYLVL
ncbi:hypothetical protein DBR42_14270, partial [Pelomonas sp. HMWF004]